MSTFFDKDKKNWAFAHAYSEYPIEVAVHDGPPFYYPKTEALYLVSGADNAEELMRLGITKKAFHGEINPPAYRHAIIRNGPGIGDAYFAITSGYKWAKKHGYSFDNLCIMLHPNLVKFFKEFYWLDDGQYIKPNFIPIPQVSDDLAVDFFEIWFSKLDDYVIFDCTVEEAFTRTTKNIRFLASKNQRNLIVPERTYFEENLRACGCGGSHLQLCFVPGPESHDKEFEGYFRNKVVWHARGSHVSKWYPHMLETATILRDIGIETVFLSAPSDIPFIDGILNSGQNFPVLSNDIPARIVSHMLRSDPLCYIGQETGVSAILSLMDLKKIILMSHTDQKQFSDWKNTVCLTPHQKPPCQPCYLAHADFSRCFMDKETKSAMCQALIEPSQIVHSVISKS